MAFNDLTDSRSRDQYPVDDDQDGKFSNIDNEDGVLGEDSYPTPADIPSGLHPEDGYEDENDEEDEDDSLDGLQEDDADENAEEARPVQLQAANDDDDDSDNSQPGGDDNQDDDSGDTMNQFQDAHNQAGADQVREVAAAHFGETEADDFQQSVDQGVSGLADHHVSGLAGTVMNALQGAGLPADQVAQEAGLSSGQPNQMDKGDLSSLLGYAQQYAPGALGDAVANQPALAQALGNPMVKGLLGKLFG